MRRRRIKYIALLAAAVLALSSCGGASKYDYAAGEAASTEAYAPAAAPAEEPMDNGYSYESESVYDEASEVAEEGYDTAAGGISSTTGIDSIAGTGQKLIKTVNMGMETKEFDSLMENIRAKVEELGGYIESSEISGSSYYSMQGNRYAWMQLRIPADKLDGFVTIVSELGNVTNKSESVQDITLQYVDVESHKKALETEQDRLLELLEQAESMEDIITIESRLSELRYELQSYGSTLRTYDNQVSYSTVTLNIQEVERVTPIVEERSFVEEIQYRLAGNFYDIGQGLRNFAIWFISSLPYLAIWAVVIFVLVILIRKLVWRKPFFRRRKKKTGEIKEAETDKKEDVH